MNTAIVSGASGAVGRVVTERFLKGAWRVYALTRRAESAQGLSQNLSQYGQRLHVVVCDIANPSSVHNFLTTSQLHQCHAVVHCAGGIRAGTLIEETSPEVVQAMLEINYLTAYNLLRATLPLLKSSGGAVVTIAATSALRAEMKKSAYAASKAALIALTQATAHEGKQYGVRANCIIPSIIDTPANREWGTPEQVVHWVRLEHIAEAVWMLCTDAGQGISGALLPMTGTM
ncbi:MAG: SDR family NAD(P)-dependent oxidoreductase [Bacteroidota bacterium]|nr:SDR family NAD(P)-dependent oxidoreductase [Bacteroidota bacterium]